jgi:hypothetical protein
MSNSSNTQSQLTMEESTNIIIKYINLAKSGIVPETETEKKELEDAMSGKSDTFIKYLMLINEVDVDAKALGVYN